MAMDKKRSRITYLLIAGTLCLAAWAASAMPRLHSRTLPSVDVPPTVVKPPPQALTVPQKPPRVEVVFALDTTGSMSGLIDGAKRKIWSIAQFIAQGEPKPDLRIGLVAYRDKGDEYVTRFYDLTDDLDQVFDRLSSFQAGGGGDTPEHVSKALYDAVYRTSWTSGQAALKQVYLVGDAPPHTDYNDGFDYRAVARHAHELGIHINTIRCGSDRDTQVVWNEIANAASGEYASIEQNGGVATVTTPYDDKLAALNAKLVGTAIGYGEGRMGVMHKAEAARMLSGSAAADRAGFFGLKGGAVSGRGDLVRDSVDGLVDPAKAPEAALPPEMKPMSPDERRGYVQKKEEEREKITAEINKVARERNTWLIGKHKRDSFDAKIYGTVTKQAADDMKLVMPKF
jgi:Mg-chelatase subunit ChlD